MPGHAKIDGRARTTTSGVQRARAGGPSDQPPVQLRTKPAGDSGSPTTYAPSREPAPRAPLGNNHKSGRIRCTV